MSENYITKRRVSVEKQMTNGVGYLTKRGKFNGLRQSRNRKRFVETGRDSFFGDCLYDQIVPEDHFLRKLKQQIPWERFTRRLIKLYKGSTYMVAHPLIQPWYSR